MTLEEKLRSLRHTAIDLDCWAGRGGGDAAREYAQFLENVADALLVGDAVRACLQIGDAVRAVTTDGES